MNLIRYLLDFFHVNGAGTQSVKYAKDHTYPATDETRAHVAAGYAEVVPAGEPQPVTAAEATPVPADTPPTIARPGDAPAAQPAQPAATAEG